MEIEKRCLRQMVDIPIPLDKRSGSGDCKSCEYDPENNPICRAYIVSISFEVVKK